MKQRTTLEQQEEPPCPLVHLVTLYQHMYSSSMCVLTKRKQRLSFHNKLLIAHLLVHLRLDRPYIFNWKLLNDIEGLPNDETNYSETQII